MHEIPPPLNSNEPIANQQSANPAKVAHEKAGGWYENLASGLTTFFQWVLYIGTWGSGIGVIVWCTLFVSGFVIRPEFKPGDFVHPDGMNEAQAVDFVERINVCRVSTHAPNACYKMMQEAVTTERTTANYSHVQVPPRGNG